jgi:hypothetical protein
MSPTKLFILLSLIAFGFSCSKKEGIAPSLDLPESAYFDAAKQYITYNTTFGPATNVTRNTNVRIDFSNSVVSAHRSTIGTNIAHVASLRKSFTINAERTLITLKRILPSQRDGTTMSVSMTSGVNKAYLSGLGRRRTHVITQCSRIVFNATGQGVCLNLSNGEIVASKLSTRYAERLVSSCNDGGAGDINCYRWSKSVSRKYVNSTGAVLSQTFK